MAIDVGERLTAADEPDHAQPARRRRQPNGSFASRPVHPAIMAPLQIAAVAGVLLYWWWGTENGNLAAYQWGKPERVWRYLVEHSGSGALWRDLSSTIAGLALGCGLGVAAGMAIGIAAGAVRRIAEIIEPFVVALNATPRKVFIPLFVVAFGLGLTTKVLHVSFVVMFPVAISVLQGMRQIESGLVENYTALGASRRHLLRYVYIPGVSSWVVSSIRFTVGLGFQAVVLAEIVMGKTGLGSHIFRSQTFGNVSGVWAVLLVLLVLSFVVDHALGRVERRVHRWKVA